MYFNGQSHIFFLVWGLSLTFIPDPQPALGQLANCFRLAAPICDHVVVSCGSTLLFCPLPPFCSLSVLFSSVFLGLFCPFVCWLDMWCLGNLSNVERRTSHIQGAELVKQDCSLGIWTSITWLYLLYKYWPLCFNCFWIFWTYLPTCPLHLLNYA